MKNSTSYLLILLAVCNCFLVSCVDENFIDKGGHEENIQLKLSIPSPTNNQLKEDQSVFDPSIPEQSVINDISVLVFDSEDKLIEVVNPLHVKEEKSDQSIVLEGLLKKRSESVTLAILANIEEKGADEDNTLSSSYIIENFSGKQRTDIYKSIVYHYPEENTQEHKTYHWDINKRKLPMWGEIPNVSLNNDINKSCLLYRAVAKVGITVACDNFKMTEIYVFNANDRGYVAPIAGISEGNEPFTQPNIPEDSQKITSLKYNLKGTESLDFLNQIYLAEADNKTAGAKPVKIVVGGIYIDKNHEASKTTQYYRIDLQNDKDTPGTQKPFDIIRNHSYLFKIINVLNPGENTPEKALANLKVVILDYIEDQLLGIPGQYSLTTDRSVIRFENFNDRSEKDLTIWTDLKEGWTIEQDEECSNWFSISQTQGEKDKNCKITVTPKSINNETTRESSFYVVAGNLKKEIKIIMPQRETSNSYIVGDGLHTLMVNIKGNGKEGVITEDGVSLIPGNPHPTKQDITNFVTLPTRYVKVLWETESGLIKLKDSNGITVDNDVSNYSSGYLELPDKVTSVDYVVNSDHANIGGARGGNALIGAFDDNKNLLWSWHIWVAPDFIDEGTQQVNHKYIEDWTINGYKMMDRNLGALDNKPTEIEPNKYSSVASMGLLYQWGRKDPFIGASFSKGSNETIPLNNGLLNVCHYYQDWGILDVDFTPETIATAIKNPTQLIKNNQEQGLMNIPGFGEYLWGIKNGLTSNAKKIGSKTIYDPSPAGFKMPPVDAFVFKVYGKDTQVREHYVVGELIKTIQLEPGEEYFADLKKTIFYQEVDNTGSPISAIEILDQYSLKNQGNTTQYYKIYSAIKVETTEKETFFSSAKDNWRFNLIFVPHFPIFEDNHNPNYKKTWLGWEVTNEYPQYKYQWGNSYKNQPVTGDNKKNQDTDIAIYKCRYIRNADYYGLYISYQDICHEPILDNRPKTDGKYKKSSSGSIQNNGEYLYKLAATERNISWFPITGIYDPQKGEFNLHRIPIQKGYSVTVNSFLWTNTTVSKENRIRPAAMFLHGTEDNGSSIMNNSEGKPIYGHVLAGRHIHTLTDTKIEAKSDYAGAVRCIVDEKKLEWDINSLTEAVEINNEKDAQTSITIVSVNSNWKLVKPGAPWLVVTPDEGVADKGRGSVITLKFRDATTLPDIGEQTTLEFHIEGEIQNRVVTVTVTGNK